MNRSFDLAFPRPGQAGVPAWDRPTPPRQPSVDPRPDLLVVGAGLAGLAVAVEARRRGIDRVLLVDREGIAPAASGRNAGALIPDVHALTMPAAFADLARRGLELHRELHDRLALPLRSIDWIVPLSSEGDDPLAERLAASDVAILDRSELEARIGTTTGIERGALVADQALTDPVVVSTALARLAGGVADVTATRLEVRGDRVLEVATTAGSIRPGAVVLATGWAPAEVVEGQRWVKGHLALTAPAPFGLTRTAIGGEIIAIPQRNGRLLVGASREDDVAGTVDWEVTNRIRSQLARILPAAAVLAFEQVWTGQRPASADGLPVIDRLPGTSSVYVIAGLYHSGLCTAPAIAEAVVQSLETGRLPDRLGAFAIDR